MLCDNRVGLSSNRLAIIDLLGGQQPIFNEDGSCAIVFNGEIYNYRELRHDLQRRHRFQTATDTEVILHLYEEKGSDVSRYLSGDFAFCIWDSRDGSCLLSRDPLGVKPLYYAITKSGNLVFCSELTPLLKHPEIDAELDWEAVLEYFTCLYIAAPRSLIRGVYKLRSGESLVWKNSAVRRWLYWEPPGVNEPDVLYSTADFREKVAELLKNAVSRRLIADVPVGAFLSGGIDSSLIVALASQESPGLQTFSIGYKESDFDELQYAREVSRHCNTSHHEFLLTPEEETLLEEVIDAMDEPIADSSAVATFLVARETAQFVKVALSGVGGDELFSGYPRYLGAKLSEILPPACAPLVSKMLSQFASRPSGRDLRGWLRRFGEGLRLEPRQRYWLWTTFLDRHTREKILSDRIVGGAHFEQESAELFACGAGDYLDKIIRFDLKRYLASDLLKFADNMTMAHSLELRVPFCDLDLVELVLRTPAATRFPGYRLKPVLKDIARDYLPAKVVQRRKQGFMIPIGRWFRHQLRPYIQSALKTEKLPSFLNPIGVQQLLAEHLAEKGNHTHLLWAGLVLSRWLALHPEIKLPDVFLVGNDDFRI
jgi:asparagine synthase (glutamine-hydrolysing)